MNSRPLKELLPRGVRRRLGAARRWLRARPRRTRRQKEALLAAGGLSAAERTLLDGVESRIHYDDGMYKGDGAHYFKVGLDAVRCIEEALAAARLIEPRAILDLPCGYGRVLRFLGARFPAARVTACELMPEAVRFCAETFGAIPAQSAYDFDALTLDVRYDLIWCGSLVTHLDAARTGALLRFFARTLAPGGLLLFTTHGEFVAGRVQAMHEFYGLNPADIPALVASFRETGHGYLDYPEGPGYGVSLTAPDWLRARAREIGDLREVYFRAQGWDRHQDVFGFVKQS
ncbi:MAG TPA: class I SAM-dependent methyltransferase [Pyrinomonadaceae bacterium]|jgi:SAM-dependent methyltransferase